MNINFHVLPVFLHILLLFQKILIGQVAQYNLPDSQAYR